MADNGREILIFQERGVAQSRTVLFQRHDQSGRRRARRANSQRSAQDRLQFVLRLVRTGKPSPAETSAFGFRSMEQGGRLLSGVQYVGRAHTASDGEKRIGCSKGLREVNNIMTQYDTIGVEQVTRKKILIQDT